MDERQFGAAGARVVLEECLVGPEVSFFALCDGTRAIPLASAQDHKRVFDDDEGPNTGGMGAFAPSPLIDDATRGARHARDRRAGRCAGMRAEGHEYRGFLYAGLMMTCDGPKVIEFNVRFGDPEAQVVMPLIDGELAPLLAAAADGACDRRVAEHARRVARRRRARVAGYPGRDRRGVPIAGLDAASQRARRPRCFILGERARADTGGSSPPAAAC